MHCSVPEIWEFLHSLLDGGQSPATLRVYVAARQLYVAARVMLVWILTVGGHRLASLFLKGTLRLRPHEYSVPRHGVCTWCSMPCFCLPLNPWLMRS